MFNVSELLLYVCLIYLNPMQLFNIMRMTHNLLTYTSTQFTPLYPSYSWNLFTYYSAAQIIHVSIYIVGCIL